MQCVLNGIYWANYCMYYDGCNNTRYAADSQFEEGGSELQQQDMGQPVLVHNQHSLHRAPHPDLLKLLAHALKPGGHRAVLFIQRLFRAKCVIGQRISRAKHKTFNNNGRRHYRLVSNPANNIASLLPSYQLNNL